MDSELTDLAGVKGVTISTLQPKPSEGAFANGDKTKLDAIEPGATADQTDAEIRTAVESATDSNVFTDADHSKLNGIEASATADQTDAEIKTAYENNSDTNAFTDAEKTKLTNIEASADVTDTANVTSAGALMDSELASIADVKALDQSVVSGATPTFTTTNFTDDTDKRFMTDAQESKLDGIEASATADQTDAEIRAAVEAATDSNVFTDADHTKLNAIEASADVTDTANVTAAGALMDSEVDADIKTLSLPANTTISAFGKTLVDDADAATARTTLGVDASGTDNSTDVTLAGSLDYITISGQEITRNAINLSTDVTGTLPVGNMAATALTTVQTAANESAHLALTAQEGDVVVRSDQNKTYMHNGGTAGTMDDYTLLATPTDAVTSVNGNTGVVTVTENVTTNLSITGTDAARTIVSSDGTDAVIPVATDSVSGVMSAADHTKLTGIETSADVTDTANVTAAGALMDSELASIADVKALDQSVISGASPTFGTANMSDATNKRFMTDAQETKLDSVESSADVTDTANVTAAGALMDSELTDLAGVKGVTISTLQVKPSEGAFANGDKTKLDGIEASADVTDTANVTSAGAVMDSELTSIADVKALDQSVISGASPNFTTTNMTDATNKRFMSDAQETKLDSVESSATADQTASEILTAVKTVDGASSGLDADLLDGVQGSSYLRSDADDTYTGALTVTGTIALSSHLDMPDNATIKIGTGDDLNISHNGTNSIISNSTGFLDIRSDTVHIDNAANNEKMAQFTADGSVDLYYDNSKKFETTTSGINVTGKLGINNSSPDSNLHIKGTDVTGGIFVEDNSTSSASPVIKVQGTRAAGNTSQSFGGGFALSRLRSDQLATDNIHLGTLYFGTNHTDGTAANIAYSASIAARLSGDANSASDMPTDLVFYTGSTGRDLGTANVTYGTEGMRIDASGNVSIPSGDLDMPDNGKIKLGTSDDLEIYHSGGASWIKDEGTGQLNITTNGTDIRLATNTSEKMLVAKPNESVELYFDNSKKLETTTSGIDVTGKIKMFDTGGTQLRIGYNSTYFWDIGREASNGRLGFFETTNGVASGEHMTILTSGNVGIGYTNPSYKLSVNGGVMTHQGYFIGSAGDNYLYGGTDIVNLRVGTTSSYRYFNFADRNGGSSIGTASGALSLGIGADDYLTIDTSGNVSIPSGDLDMPDNGKIKLGTGDDLEIYHDGSNSWIRDGGTGNLNIGGDADVRIMGNSGTEFMARFIANGNVNLYHNNNLKFQTISTGIDVTGSITGDALTVDTTASNGVTINAHDNLTTTYPLKVSNAAGTGNLELGTYGINNDIDLRLQKGGSTKLRVHSSGVDVTGTVEFDGLSGTGAVTVTDILDEDDMSSNSATALATQQSIKAYVDANGGGSGDITAVVAGTGLSGGATSGSATLNIDAAVVPATATELSSSVDLNDLDGESDAGFYYQTSNADTTGNNYPDNRAGSLIVQKSAAGVTQLYSTFHPSTPELYFRTYYGTGGNTWNSWRKVWTDGNDGSGSGLDADTLDGVQGADYLRAKTRTTWNTSPAVIGNVVGQLAWKNYGNNHTIFDASAGTTPSGGSCSAEDPSVAWAGTYPTLMGWNGTNTYGVRVDRAKRADNLDGLDSTQFLRSDTSDTFTGTLTVTGNIALSGHLDMPDSAYVKLGTGDDLQLYHDGSNSYVRDVGTGDLYLDTNSGVHLYANGSENMLYAVPNGAVTLYYDNSAKLATTSSGINVTGTGEFDSMIVQSAGGYGNIEMGGPNGAYIDLKKPYSDDYDFRIMYDDTASLKTTGNYVSTSTASGYVHIGPQNTSYCHFSTDRSKFYFNKQINVDSGIITSHNEDLQLRRSNSTTDQLTIASGSATFGGEVVIPNKIIHSGDTDTYLQFHAANEFRVVVAGNERFEVTSTNVTIPVDMTIADQIIHQGDTNTYMQFHAADQWRVVTGGTERLEVNNTQTTVNQDLDVNGTIDLRADGNTTAARYVHLARGGGITFYGDAGASHSITSRNNAGTVADDLNISSYGAVYIMLDKNNNNGSGADFKIYRNNTTTVALTVSGENGNLTAEGDITAFSDERLKENIKVIPNAIEKVSQIRGVTYTRNDQKDKEKVYAGVIAQEVEKVLPEVVNTTEDDTKTVAYGNMVGLLIEAVKEQQEQINELKKQIEEMK